jgi:alpha-tubulin suppressor-like RCC1 family protein
MTLNPHTSPTWSSPSGVKKVAAGWAHMMVLLDDGSLWSWGYNASCQASLNGPEFIYKPRRVDLTGVEGKLCGIIAGDNFSTLITDSGEFYIFGLNLHLEGDPVKYSEFKVKVPQTSSKILWQRLKFLFLGNGDENSTFFVFPKEVIFHFVQVMQNEV